MLSTRSYVGNSSKRHATGWPGFKQSGLSTSILFVCSIMYIFTARVLGTRAFGIYAFLYWLVTCMLPAFGIGMSALTSRSLVNLQRHETGSSKAGIFYFLWYCQWRSILLYSLFFLLLAWPLYLVFSISTPLRLFLSCLAALPLFLNSIVDITLRSMRRVELIAFLHLGGTLITLALIIGASQVAGQRLELFLLAYAVAGMLTLIIALLCIARLLPFKEARLPDLSLRTRLQSCFKNSALDFFIDIVIWQPGELLLLALWRTPAELGFYMIGILISTAIMRLTPALMSAWLLPFFLRRRPGSHYTGEYDAFFKTSCYMTFLAVPICIVVTLLSPLVIGLTLGVEYLPLVQPLRILLIGSVFGSVATVSLTRLVARGQVKARQILGIGAALLNIAIALPCTALWGMSGAALASTSAQILSAIGLVALCGNSLRQEEGLSAKIIV